MTGSIRIVLKVIQQDFKVTQKINDMWVTMIQSNISWVLKKSEITKKKLVKKSEKVVSHTVISLRKGDAE